MSCEQAAATSIRASGLRITNHRVQVLSELMHAGDHLTARNVVQRVGTPSNHSAPSTVYRTLATLRDARLVTETLMATGETVYESAVASRHHHAECRSCGNLVEIDAAYFDGAKQQLLDDLGFDADLDHLSIRGVCVECQSKTSSGVQA
jgi:Fur family ferric uptake transcriptional regulator